MAAGDSKTTPTVLGTTKPGLSVSLTSKSKSCGEDLDMGRDHGVRVCPRRVSVCELAFGRLAENVSCLGLLSILFVAVRVKCLVSIEVVPRVGVTRPRGVVNPRFLHIRPLSRQLAEWPSSVRLPLYYG